MDSFWSASAQEALPHAVSRLQESLTSQFRQVQGSDTGDSISAGEGVGAGKSDAQLVFEKRALEMHSKLVSHLTLEAQRRALDHFFEVEQRMFVAPSSVDIDAVEDLLSGFRVAQDPDEVSSDTVTEMERLPAESTPQDRLRLFLILYLRCSVDDQALQHLFGKLKSCGADLRVFRHLVFLAERYPAIIARRGRGVISGLLSAGAERLKAIIREKPPMILAQTVRNLLVSGLEEQGDEERDGSEGHAGSGGWGDADFITLDPWAGKDIKDGGGAYDHVMVFVVGGGNYVEQADIFRTLKACGHDCVYGTTAMVAPEEFLAQMASA